MKRKLLPLAIIAASAGTAAQAQAQTQTQGPAGANVTIYGNLRAEMINLRADGGPPGTDVPQRNRIGSPGVFNIGFRGSERLGGGLTAIWQVEQNVGGADGTGNANTWGSRNTFLGLAGGFGRVFLGNFDSPYKQVLGINNYAFGLTGPTGLGAIMTNGVPTGAAPIGTSPDTGFARRNNNSVNYASPVFSGFQVRAQYVANEGRTVNSGAPGVNPYIWGGALDYNRGPLRIGAGYEKHVAFRLLPGGGTLDDQSWVVAVRYTTGPFLATGAYSRLEYGSAQGDIRRDNWLVGGQYSAGVHRFRVQYLYADDARGPNTFTAANLGTQNGTGLTSLGGIRATGGSTGANMLSLGYGYALSRRTELYLLYSRLANKANARNNFQGAHAAITTANGQTATAFGFGMRTSF